MQAIAREVTGTRIASLARCKREDIDAAAVRSSQPSPIESIPSWPLRIFTWSTSFGSHVSRLLDQVAESVRQARTFTDDVEFSIEDGTRTDPDFLVKMITVAVQAGATTINIPDTVGYTTPEEYAQRSSAW